MFCYVRTDFLQSFTMLKRCRKKHLFRRWMTDKGGIEKFISKYCHFSYSCRKQFVALNTCNFMFSRHKRDLKVLLI